MNSIQEEKFLELATFITENTYELEAGYVMSEQDEIIATALMSYFVEVYKEPSMAEACATIAGAKDVNEDLYMEIIEALLDESFGSFVAGAVHGVGNMLAKRKVAKDNNAANSMARKAIGARVDSHAHDNNGGSGLMHKVKSSFLKAKSASASAKHQVLRSKTDASRTALDNKQQKRGGLASKIDNHIANAKKKVVGAVTNIATSAASTAGRLAA